ncbi:unnamed protein product [Dibothriocephalus latus]|uniref:Uncharacterized protein n=1 Tax=Dibothriocephalus latus TaxID=60516 RepID=A0A3P6QGH0_DIBLA|nr:unnamed protein product [Dibothriocephalus latus]
MQESPDITRETSRALSAPPPSQMAVAAAEKEEEEGVGAEDEVQHTMRETSDSVFSTDDREKRLALPPSTVSLISTPETEYRNSFGRGSLTGSLLGPHETLPPPSLISAPESEYRNSFNRTSLNNPLVGPSPTAPIVTPPRVSMESASEASPPT